MDVNTTTRDEGRDRLQARPREELRLALSLRGGVSLAVWIGGALAEIDQLAHAKDRSTSRPVGPTAKIYDELLDLAGFDRVLIDVITGASAGGLNGVIYAASQIYGFAFDMMLDVWIRLGDIEKLTRPQVGRYTDPTRPDGPTLGRPSSLLRGDEYFQRQLEAQLMTSIGTSLEDARQDPLELILTATLARPAEVERDDDPFTNIIESRNNALFRFQYLGRPDDLGDYQSRHVAVAADEHGRPLPTTTAARLALAGRATSSFPFAFEPARIDKSMAPVFSDAPDDGAVWVIDGGVLDNIPVGKAIDAIAAAPAASKTERWLLYLHPSPPGVGKVAKSATTTMMMQAPAPRAVHTALGALGTAFGQENLLQDLEQLRQFNEEAERQRLRRAGQFIRFDGLSGKDFVDAAVHAGTTEAVSAVALRCDLDAQRLHDVLTGQAETASLGDGLPRNPTATWPRPQRDSLAACISGSLRASSGDGYILRDGISQLMLIDVLIAWLRDLEARLGVDVSIEKASLYSARLIADRLRQAADRVWVIRAGLPGRDHSAATATASVVRSICLDSPPQASDVLQAFDIGADVFVVDQSIDQWDAAIDEIARTTTTHDSESLPSGVDFTDKLWDRVVGVTASVCRRLEAMQVVSASPTAVSFLDRPRAFDLLDEAAAQLPPDSSDAKIIADVLGSLVVLLTPLQARTVQMESALRFLEVSGNNSSPLEKYFKLKDGRVLDARAKLCGNDLANFAAFFSAKWRANDWMWGRLDAAKSIVDLLLRPERLSLSTLSAAEIADRLIAAARSSGVPLNDTDVAAIRHEVDLAMAGQSIPPGTAALQQTKAALVEAVQRHIVEELLDRVLELDETPPAPAAPTASAAPNSPVAPKDPMERLATYRVGDETIASLNPRHRTQVGMRLAMVGFKALQPDGSRMRTRMSRLAIRLVKPVYLYGAFTALSLPRALFLVTLAVAGVLIGPWRYRTWKGFSWLKPFDLPHHHPFAVNALHIFAIAVLVGLSGFAFSRWWSWRRRAGRTSNQRWRMLAALCAPVGIVLDVIGARMTPVMVIAGATIIAALATSWMVASQRLVSSLVTLAAYALTAAGSAALAAHRGLRVPIPNGAYCGWWSIVSASVAASLLAVQCSYVDVLPSVE